MLNNRLHNKSMSKDKEWNVEDYIERLLPKKGALSEAFTFAPYVEIKKEDITYEMIEECYVFMAHIVRDYGEQYLPIFERLHSELEVYKKRQKMLDKALSVSKKNPNYH
ncbi:MAG: hypothetical protein COB49_11445 [Alphaproteobacteria bacterium]|nr:MAG: hypothetical protein COB49_11445 [Alphaproteobacteria bacterium]